MLHILYHLWSVCTSLHWLDNLGQPWTHLQEQILSNYQHKTIPVSLRWSSGSHCSSMVTKWVIWSSSSTRSSWLMITGCSWVTSCDVITCDHVIDTMQLNQLTVQLHHSCCVLSWSGRLPTNMCTPLSPPFPHIHTHTLKPSFLMANITSIMYCTLTSNLPSFSMALRLSYTPGMLPIATQGYLHIILFKISGQLLFNYRKPQSNCVLMIVPHSF